MFSGVWQSAQRKGEISQSHNGMTSVYKPRQVFEEFLALEKGQLELKVPKLGQCYADVTQAARVGLLVINSRWTSQSPSKISRGMGSSTKVLRCHEDDDESCESPQQ